MTVGGKRELIQVATRSTSPGNRYGIVINSRVNQSYLSGVGVGESYFYNPGNPNTGYAYGVPMGTWMHVAITTGEDGSRVYIDGILVKFLNPRPVGVRPE